MQQRISQNGDSRKEEKRQNRNRNRNKKNKKGIWTCPIIYRRFGASFSLTTFAHPIQKKHHQPVVHIPLSFPHLTSPSPPTPPPSFLLFLHHAPCFSAESSCPLEPAAGAGQRHGLVHDPFADTQVLLNPLVHFFVVTGNLLWFDS